MSNAVARMDEAQPRAVAAVTPMQMLQIAIEKNANLDQLQKLMDLQERWEANEARKAYVAALSAFKAEPPTVVKMKRADYGKDRDGKSKTAYSYATLAQVANVIAPALSKHGLSHNWTTRQDGNNIAVTCNLTHELGHSESVTMAAGADTTGSKNSIQAIGSTVTYLQRYTLLAITGLAAEDQDNDGDGIVQLISGEQKLRLVEIMQELNVDGAKFLNYLGVDYLDNLPASRFDQALAALEKKRKG